MGHKRDVDLTPLAARTNRLGVKSKAAQQSVPAGKVRAVPCLQCRCQSLLVTFDRSHHYVM